MGEGDGSKRPGAPDVVAHPAVLLPILDARAKHRASPEALRGAAKIAPYVPPGPGCSPVAGLPPSQCSAYRVAADWLPPAFVQNATCACETTPDCASANAVRQTLQKELAATDPTFVAECRARLAQRSAHPDNPIERLAYDLWVAEHFAPVAYTWHQKAYATGCCKCGPAPFLDWVLVCTVPIDDCRLVEASINLFGSCDCTPGKW